MNTVLYCIALHCISIVLHGVVLYCIAWYCIVLYCIVLYGIVLYCKLIVLYLPTTLRHSDDVVSSLTYQVTVSPSYNLASELRMCFVCVCADTAD